MLSINDSEMKCALCGIKKKKNGCGIPFLIFTYLEGSPALCEKCMFMQISHLINVDWDKDFKRLMDGK